MSGYDDRYDGPDDRADRGPDEARDLIRRARARVALPGMLLIIVGAIGAAVEVTGLAVAVANPTVLYDVLVKWVESQPESKERQKTLDDLKQKKDEMRLDTPTNLASTVFGLCLSLAMVVGGAMMRKMSVYAAALTGAIAGLLPCGGCCCLSFPVGLWALIVLMNVDVKAAFEAARSGSASLPPDAY
jgi:hypothetical protein